MPQPTLEVFSNQLKPVVERAMHQTPDVFDIHTESANELPTPSSTRRWWVVLDVGINALPVLHLAVLCDTKLETAWCFLILGTPEVLDHDRRSIAKVAAKDFGWSPGCIGAGSRAPEHLQATIITNGDDVEVALAITIVIV